jgi:hypothetical protein
VFEQRRRDARGSVQLDGALWAFAPGASGALGSLEVVRRMVHHADVVLGFEEQHGTRRDPVLAASPARGSGMRQGAWCEWRGRSRGRTLVMRHELWGRRAFARQASRRALTVRGTAALRWGATLAVGHEAWSTRDEPLYLPEIEPDRITLRASSGEGERARAELEAPLLGGRARASVEWTRRAGRRTAPGWSMQWTRRTRQ